MARITNYSTLATAVQEYLSRTDVGVASGNLDYLLSEAEEEMNSRLRVHRMLTAAASVVPSSTGVVTLPTDFMGWKRFQMRDGVNEFDLDLRSAEETTEVSRLYGTYSGIPQALLMLTSTAQIWPYTHGVYTFACLYYARIPQLTSGAATNWVVTNYPNAYLYGCLAAARGLVKEETPAGASRFDVWAKRFDMAIKRIEREDARDLEGRNNTRLEPDTSLFTRRGKANIEADG